MHGTDPVERAETLHDLGRPSEALAMLATASVEHLQRVDYWILRARLCLAIDDYPAAVQAADRACGIDPTNGVAHVLRSTALLRSGQRDQAVAAAERAIELAPYYWPGHVALSEASDHYVADNIAAARADGRGLAAAREAVELAPHEPHTYVALHAAHLRREEWTAAQEAADRALELDPTDADVHNDLGVAQLRAQCWAPAAASFARAAEMDPTGPGPSNFSLACRALFDRRIQIAVFTVWVSGFGVRAVTHGAADGVRVRVWALMAVGVLIAMLARPVAEFVAEIPAAYRRSVMRAVRGDKLLRIQVGAISLAVPLLIGAAALPAGPGEWLFVAGVVCYIPAVLLTWADRDAD